MTMDKKNEIAAGEFKAHCLALLDEVAETGKEIIVTKRGKPVAKVVPIEPPKSLEGSVTVLGDIINIFDEEDWDDSWEPKAE
jgi:prevent-host-death family protein